MIGKRGREKVTDMVKDQLMVEKDEERIKDFRIRQST